MAKKKKTGKVVPKRIAGVKVPKELRRSSGSMLQMAQTPIVREIIASGLVAAAAAMAGSDSARGKGRKAKRNMGKWAQAGAQGVNETAQAAGAALTAAMDKWFGDSLHRQPTERNDAQRKPAGKQVPTAH